MISTTLSPLVEKLSNFLSAHPDHPVLVALDGRCGSGKTTLAAQLARQFPQSITVHTDDFYLPPASRVANWEQIPCANMDLERLCAQVLTPARAGQAIPYRAYSCRAGAYLPEQCFAPQPLVIVEGSYSCHPTLADCYDLKVFVTCSKEEQARRLLARRENAILASPPGGSRWKRGISQNSRSSKPLTLSLIRPVNFLQIPALCPCKPGAKYVIVRMEQ